MSVNVKTPMLFMWVSGNELSDEFIRKIIMLNITYREKKASDGTMTISDPDFAVADSNLFSQGRKFAFMLGWSDEARICGPFTVKGYRTSAPAGGNPIFEVSFQDYSHKMNKKQKSRKHTGKLADILVKICEEHDLGYDIEDVDDFEFSDDFPLIQANMTDARLIQRMSEKYGFVWGLEGRTLYFRRPADFDVVGKQKEIPVLSYRIKGADLLSFDAEVKFHKKGKKKEAKQEGESVNFLSDVAEGLIGKEAVDNVRETIAEVVPSLGKVLNVESTQKVSDEKESSKNPSSKKKTRIDVNQMKGFFKVVTGNWDELEEEATDRDQSGTPDSADEEAKKQAGKILGTTELVEATIVPKLASMIYEPGQSIIIGGIGERYSGKYHIQEVTQSYGGSPAFSTSLRAVKRTFFPSPKDKKAIADKEDDRGPGNQNSADGKPSALQSAAAVFIDADQIKGRMVVRKELVKKINGINQ